MVTTDTGRCPRDLLAHAEKVSRGASTWVHWYATKALLASQDGALEHRRCPAVPTAPLPPIDQGRDLERFEREHRRYLERYDQQEADLLELWTMREACRLIGEDELRAELDEVVWSWRNSREWLPRTGACEAGMMRVTAGFEAAWAERTARQDGRRALRAEVAEARTAI